MAPAVTFRKFKSKLAQQGYVTQQFIDKKPKFTLRQALSAPHNVYNALLSELFEAGCRKAAKYFDCLVQKEDDLIAGQFVKVRLRDNRDLLFQVFENVRLAESSLTTGPMGMATCLQILYQTVMLLTPHDDKYHWLIDDLYKIVVNFAENHDDNDILSFQIKARIYVSFAMYLENMREPESLVTMYYKKSLKMCRGQSWEAHGMPNVGLSFTLHEFVALKLARCFINYAKACSFRRALHAVRLARRAVLAIAEVDCWNVKDLLSEAFCVKIRFLTELELNEEAMDNIMIAEKHFAGDADWVAVSIELAIYKARCWQNFREPFKALLTLKKSLLLCRRHKLNHLQARALLEIGKLYMKYEKAAAKARCALSHSKRLFKSVNNDAGVQNAVYVLALLHAKTHFPDLMRLMRRLTKTNAFCDLYSLRQWKNTCIPFWRPELDKDSDEEIYLQPALHKIDAELYDEDIAILMADERDLFLADERQVFDSNIQKCDETQFDADSLYCLLKPSA